MALAILKPFKSSLIYINYIKTCILAYFFFKKDSDLVIIF